MSSRVLLLPGDGVGPEVVAQAEKVLTCLGRLQKTPPMEITSGLVGGAAVDAEGAPLPASTLQAVQNADAVLLGAVGGPAYDSLPADKRPEKGLLALRREMGVFANLRPAFCHAPLASASSLRPPLVEGLDILIVRELIGGIYFGEPRGISVRNGVREGVNTMRYDENEVARTARTAFEAARRRRGMVCSADKANVLEASAVWRETVSAVGAADYPDVELSHMYADNAAMQLVREPKQFDVILADNLFGDILSDAAAMLTGSIGMLPSAALGEGGRGLYEPVHGAAPDIAGRDIANPLAAILSAAMMLRHSFDNAAAADAVEKAVGDILDNGLRTADIARENDSVCGCNAMGDAVVAKLEK